MNKFPDTFKPDYKFPYPSSTLLKNKLAQIREKIYNEVKSAPNKLGYFIDFYGLDKEYFLIMVKELFELGWDLEINLSETTYRIYIKN